MIRQTASLLILLFFTALIIGPATAQNEVQIKLTRDQKRTTSLGVTNTCSAIHVFELSDNPQITWLKIIDRPAAIAPGATRNFVIELNSANLNAGSYLGEVPITCVDCATEPRCGPTRFTVPFRLTVHWSTAEAESWQQSEYVPGEILVTLRGQSREINRIIRILELRHQLRKESTVKLSSTGEVLVRFTVRNPNQSIPELVLSIQNGEIPLDFSVQPNFIYTGSGSQGQDYESLQFGPKLIRSNLVSPYSTGKGVRIGLVDTGVDKHRDLKEKIIERKNFTDDKELRRDSHGTIMAGIISAIPNNGFGINGVAPDAKIISIKVLKQVSPTVPPRGTSFTIVQGINYAIERKVQIVNLSIGASQPDPKVSDLVRAAVRRGIVIVAGAGNDGPGGRPSYPAALSEVIAVSAVDHYKRAYVRGTTGEYIDLAATGVGILSTWPENTFHDSDGSSEAAAHVTGVVALLLEKKPTISPAQIQNLLERTATDLGPRGKDSIFGSGLVDACESLKSIMGIGQTCSVTASN
ncbi:MAG TPA: S8 family serine peptidase [Pyrinomonadaceae bacterium]|nr:S8 family serine peptidase [Pyrinomonadaceae bacterium]